LDERADREDLDVRVVGAGSKMDVQRCEDVAGKMLEFKPDFTIMISPNATLPGPTKAREILSSAGVPTVIISDGPTKKIAKDLEAAGFGYIIVEADAMIGARREFLDPIEMALFNADIIRVLSTVGVYNIIVEKLNGVIDSLKRKEKPELPRVIINKEVAVEAANFQNPYAKAKVMAAHEMARRVADLTTEGCFVVKEPERYVPIVAAAHEVMRQAAKLADEAREIEKGTDSVYRAPHHRDGTMLEKRALLEKPKRRE
jgi:methylenetetrahydromethanopterin dehydrogenase